MKLRIYPHQVTGHACLLITEDGYTIGKPVSRNEVDFYKTMDRKFDPFVPEFRGVGYVTMETDQDGNDCYSVVSCDRELSSKSDKDIVIVEEEECLSYKSLQRHEYTKMEGFTIHQWTKDKDISAATTTVGLNPWVGRVRKVGKKKFEAKNGSPMHFLFLENISKCCKNPCVLDLKMGTRIYGDKCHQRKRERHIQKNAMTTTGKLGIRLTGMQLFCVDEYICKDKYYGRGLSEEAFSNEIVEFFSTDVAKQFDIKLKVLCKLESLQHAVQNLNGYRLYGSSLVIVYDGNSNILHFSDRTPTIDVRLVDFCHSTHKTMTQDEIYHPGCDKGFLQGLHNLIDIIKNIPPLTTS